MGSRVVFSALLAATLFVLGACGEAPPPTFPEETETPTPSAPSGAPTAIPFAFSLPSTLPLAKVGQPYRFSLCEPPQAFKPYNVADMWSGCGVADVKATNPRGGVPPYTLSFEDATEVFAAGFSYGDAQEGDFISGTPKLGQEGEYKLKVCAKDQTRQKICQDTTLYVLSDFVTTVGAGNVAATLRWGAPIRTDPTLPKSEGELEKLIEKSGYGEISAEVSNVDVSFGVPTFVEGRLSEETFRVPYAKEIVPMTEWTSIVLAVDSPSELIARASLPPLGKFGGGEAKTILFSRRQIEDRFQRRWHGGVRT